MELYSLLVVQIFFFLIVISVWNFIFLFLEDYAAWSDKIGLVGM